MNSVLGMIIAFDTDNDLREITEHRTVGAVQWAAGIALSTLCFPIW